jgi:hypothetical protein
MTRKIKSIRFRWREDLEGNVCELIVDGQVVTEGFVYENVDDGGSYDDYAIELVGGDPVLCETWDEAIATVKNILLGTLSAHQRAAFYEACRLPQKPQTHMTTRT